MLSPHKASSLFRSFLAIWCLANPPQPSILDAQKTNGGYLVHRNINELITEKQQMKLEDVDEYL